MKRKVTTPKEAKAKELRKVVAKIQRLLKRYEELPAEAKERLDNLLKQAHEPSKS